jgi:hypothetical protein
LTIWETEKIFFPIIADRRPRIMAMIPIPAEAQPMMLSVFMAVSYWLIAYPSSQRYKFNQHESILKKP